MANVRYIKILTLLRGLRDKIANFHDSVVSDSQKKESNRKKERKPNQTSKDDLASESC